jgi:hypothetical protein
MIAAVECFLSSGAPPASSVQLCELRDRSKSDPYPYGNSHPLGQLGGIGRANCRRSNFVVNNN